MVNFQDKANYRLVHVYEDDYWASSSRIAISN